MGKIADESMVLLHVGLSDTSTDEEKALVRASLAYAEGSIIRYLRYDPVQKVRTEYYPRRTPSGHTAEAVWEANSSNAYLRRTSGAATNELQVTHLPIRATDAEGNNQIDLRISYDGRFGTQVGSFSASSQQTEGQDFWPDYDGVDSNSIAYCSDGIIRSVGLWPEEPGSVKITYVAGYTQDEFSGSNVVLDASPIQQACIQEAARYFKEAMLKKKSGTLGWIPGMLTSEKLGDYSYSISGMLATRLFGNAYSLMPESRARLSEFVNYSTML